MKGFLLILFSCAMAFHAIAHNAKIATYTLRHVPQSGWYIEMNFARAAVDAALLDYYGSEKLEGLEIDEFKDLFTSYAKEHFKLIANDQIEIGLDQGGIKMGSHQTDMKFVLPELPLESLEKLSVYLPMFESVYNQTNIFRIYKDNQLTKFFLSEDNEFTVHMKFSANGIVEVDAHADSSSKALILSSISMFLILSFFLIRRSR